MTSKKQLTEPKDLGLKIATKKEAAWLAVKENIEKSIQQGEIEAIINKTILEKAEEMIEKEKSLNS